MRRLRLTGLLVAALVVVGGPVIARPALAAAGPSVTLSRNEAKPGERIVITLAGFTVPAVTVYVCGNKAKRGSPDCNLVQSQGVGLLRTGPTVIELIIVTPPGTCPCVIRAVSSTSTQVATADFVVLGVPVGPVVDPSPTGGLVATDLQVSPARGLAGRLRAAIGGRSTYVVTVGLRNTSETTLEKVSLRGLAGRTLEDAESLPEVVIPSLGPLQSTEQVLRASLPPPVLGRSVWQVTASGVGEPVTFRTTTHNRPWGLALLLVLLLVDVAVIAWRNIRRRRHVWNEPVIGEPDASILVADPPRVGVS